MKKDKTQEVNVPFRPTKNKPAEGNQGQLTSDSFPLNGISVPLPREMKERERKRHLTTKEMTLNSNFTYNRLTYHFYRGSITMCPSQ